MIFDVFQCSQLFSDVFSWVGTFMDNHPMCAQNAPQNVRRTFCGAPSMKCGISGRVTVLLSKSNWTKFDQVGTTGGHWETLSGSFSISFLSKLEVQSQFVPFYHCQVI